MTKKQTLEGYDSDTTAFFLKHAAVLLDRTPRTIRRWLNSGKVHGAWQHEMSGWWYIMLTEINRLRVMGGKAELSVDEAIQYLKEKEDGLEA